MQPHPTMKRASGPNKAPIHEETRHETSGIDQTLRAWPRPTKFQPQGRTPGDEILDTGVSNIPSPFPSSDCPAACNTPPQVRQQSSIVIAAPVRACVDRPLLVRNRRWCSIKPADRRERAWVFSSNHSVARGPRGLATPITLAEPHPYRGCLPVGRSGRDAGQCCPLEQPYPHRPVPNEGAGTLGKLGTASACSVRGIETSRKRLAVCGDEGRSHRSVSAG